MWQLTSHTSKESVKKCWWNEIEINCDKLFYDHFDLTGTCSVFNVDKNVFGNDQFRNCKLQYIQYTYVCQKE